MNDNVTQTSMFGTEKIYKILLRLAPPIMFAQLIQALYNIVDSYFVGKYSPDGLTALSVIFPVQLIITALAVGTGVGVNTQMARLFAQEKGKEADKTAGTGMVLSLLTWAVFAAVSAVLMLIGVFCFELLPGALLGLFSHDPDLLCALQDWALLHLDRISRLRDHYRSDRDLSLSAAGQTMGRRRGLMLLRRLRALHAVRLFILHLILHPVRHIVRLDRCHDLIDILR